MFLIAIIVVAVVIAFLFLEYKDTSSRHSLASNAGNTWWKKAQAIPLLGFVFLFSAFSAAAPAFQLCLSNWGKQCSFLERKIGYSCSMNL